MALPSRPMPLAKTTGASHAARQCQARPSGGHRSRCARGWGGGWGWQQGPARGHLYWVADALGMVVGAGMYQGDGAAWMRGWRDTAQRRWGAWGPAVTRARLWQHCARWRRVSGSSTQRKIARRRRADGSHRGGGNSAIMVTQQNSRHVGLPPATGYRRWRRPREGRGGKGDRGGGFMASRGEGKRGRPTPRGGATGPRHRQGRDGGGRRSGGAAEVEQGGRAWADPEKEERKMGRAQWNSGIFNLFKRKSLDLIKRWTSRILKISIKIWMWRKLNKEQLSLLDFSKLSLELELKIRKGSRCLSLNEIWWIWSKLSELLQFKLEDPDWTWMVNKLMGKSLEFQNLGSLDFPIKILNWNPFEILLVLLRSGLTKGFDAGLRH
jgi:hypothetical protein